MSLKTIEQQKVKEGKIPENNMLPFKKKKPVKESMSGTWKAVIAVTVFCVVIALCFAGFRLVEYCSDRRDQSEVLDIELEELEEQENERRRKRAEAKRNFHQQQVEAQ